MKIKITFFAILLLIILNIFTIKNFYFNVYWDNLFKEKIYDEAINNFKNSDNIFWSYNEWNALYKQKKYIEAIKKYLSILSVEKNKLNFNLNHNLWNSYYRFWEIEKDNNKKIKYWQEAVKYYKQALEIKYDEQTKQNLDFVLDKIKEEQKKQEEQEKKDKNNKSKTWSEKNSENNTWSWSKDKTWTWSKNEKDWDKSKSWKENNIWKSDKQWQITKEQEDAMKKYTDALKQAQKDNLNWFNKVYQDNNNNPFDEIFNDPFFDNSLLNNKSSKKDW